MKLIKVLIISSLESVHRRASELLILRLTHFGVIFCSVVVENETKFRHNRL